MDLNANSKLKRKKKTHGPGNPSKRHRDRLNAELDNLARLLPFPEEIVTKLDKISILRLTVSYLRAKSFFQVSNGRNEKEETCEELVREVEGNGVFSQLSLEALDGFIAVITQDGQLFYVSENVRDFLGHSQAAVIHQSMFKFLHIDDQDMVKSNLAWPKTSGKKTKVTGNKDTETALKDRTATGSEENESLNRSFTCRMKCTLNHGGGFYKLFRLSGRLREIHTRKRDSQVVEYGLFAICSPANSPHHSGSGVRKEVALTAQRRLGRANSDPLPNRRTGLSMPGMMQKLTMNHNFPIPEGHSSVISPLASPTTSADSGHPSPDSSQGGKATATDGDNRSGEVSPSSSCNSQDADGRLISDRFLAGIKNPFMNGRRVDHKRPASFFDSLRSTDKDVVRKRSRSMADASEFFLRECGDQRSLFYQSNLPPIPEVKAEDARKVECSYSGDMSTKRALNSHDNRLDAAQGLVNLGNIASQFPGLCPFPPELMYPDVMFPRADMLQDLQHLRGPFDMHNACYLGGDPYTALAMRRWLSSPDLFRSPLNPLLAAQAGLLTPADRLRLLQFPLGFHYPFPGPSPFDVGAIPGFGDRSHPDFAMHGFYRNGLTPDIIGGATPKETVHRHSLPSEKQSHLADGPNSPPERKSGPEIEVTVKKEKVDNDKGEETDSAKEEIVAIGKSASNAGSLSSSEEYEDEKVDVVGGVKPASVLRQTFAGIQEEFTSRLENLNKSFAQSLDCNIACPE